MPQDSTKIKSFREKLLPQYVLYFNRANLSDKGLLQLYAADKYNGLSDIDKKSIMASITAAWRQPLVLVKYTDKTELWGWNGETGITSLLDNWYLNPSLHPTQSLKTQEITPHLPWFFYVGDLFGVSGDNINFSFQLKNRMFHVQP